jgi:hypothetical protein
VSDVDPFDLPAWLGEGPVTWTPEQAITGRHQIRGVLTGRDGCSLPCDLLAVDEAYPMPVATDELRTRCHQAWRHDQVLIVAVDGRTTLAVPSREMQADLVLTALARLAHAVGAPADNYSALLRVGSDSARNSSGGR